MRGNLKIMLVDDHTLFRKALKQILTDTPGIADIEEAISGKEVIKKIHQKSFDCIVLDICLQEESGIQVLKQIKNINPDLPVLILSMYPEKQYGIRALRAGASGYATKKIPPKDLRKAIQLVCEGKKYVTSELAVELATEFDRSAKQPLHKALTDRELQILTQIASGKTISQIAKELNLSVKTVSTHRANILRKMGFSNNAQLIHYAIKHQLVY
jgi:DNA-binding NarL/FixJ family response regulator